MKLIEINKWLSVNAKGVQCWGNRFQACLGVRDLTMSGYMKEFDPKDITEKELPGLVASLARSLPLAEERLVSLTELYETEKASFMKEVEQENWLATKGMVDGLAQLKGAIEGISTVISWKKAEAVEAVEAAEPA